MTTEPGEHLEEEPQEERGPVGSRDEASDSSGGATDRPAGTSDEESDTSVDPQGSGEESPEMPSGQ